MGYIGISINESAVIAKKAGADLRGAAGKAVKFDASGNIILCATKGELAAGILPLDSDEANTGDGVTVQIKDIGKAIAGAVIEAGAEVTADAGGKIITAVATNNILGIALQKATGDGSIIDIQITKSGYKA